MMRRYYNERLEKINIWVYHTVRTTALTLSICYKT